MYKRKPISKKVRFDIFKRDQFICQYCGSHPPSVILHVDHINPVAEGGDNCHDNLITSCSDCNLGKGARSLKDVPQSLKDKAAQVSESEAQILGYNKIMQKRRDRIDSESWLVAEILEPGSSEAGFRKDNLSSIARFVSLLGVYEVIDAAEIAKTKRSWGSRKLFLYFCGICWNRVRESNHGES